MKSKLEIFTLQIREKGNRENYLDLSDIAGFNLIDELHEHIQKNIYLFKIDKEAERTYRIDKNDYKEGSIYCRIKVGKFGETSEIIDTLSGSGVFQKEREHSDTIPLFFQIKVKNKNTAYLIAQRTNNRTILPEVKFIITALLDSLRENTFAVDIKPLKEKLSIKKILKEEKAEVSKVTFTMDSNLGYETLDSINIVIKSKPRKPFPQEMLSNIVKSTESGDISTLESSLPKDIKNLKLKEAAVELKSEKFGNLKYLIGDKLYTNCSFSIPTDKEFLDKTGHPAFIKLKEFSNNLV